LLTTQTEKFYDLVGSVTFTTLTVGSLLLGGPITPKKVTAAFQLFLFDYLI
jgi:hypothetical protein